MEINPAFWKGKRVFLTGHTGFKGGWLALWLDAMGAEVSGYALPPPQQPSFFKATGVGTSIAQSIIADIRDADRLTAALTEAKPEIVFHLAAQPLVRYSYAHPAETYATNVMGLVNLLEAVRATPEVCAVVNVTSDKCYENKETSRPFSEGDPMGGFDPYSSSKACAEIVSAAYRRSYFGESSGRGPRLATARAGNVIGGGDWAADRLIPDLIRSIASGTAARIRNPNAIRPWQHVLEPLSGYLQLAEQLYGVETGFDEGWNFGPDNADALPVSDIADRLVAEWSDGASWEIEGSWQPHEAATLKLDCAKARERLGWHPRWKISTAIEKVVKWHKAFNAGANMRDFTLEQIQEYVRS